jgi:hypothetical protein
MKKLTFVLLLCFVFCLSTPAQNGELNIIPQPKSAKRLKGGFRLSRKTKIVARDESGRKSTTLLNDLPFKNYGFKLALTSAKKNPGNAIVFEEQKNLIGNPLAELTAASCFINEFSFPAKAQRLDNEFSAKIDKIYPLYPVHPVNIFYALFAPLREIQ